MIQREETTPEGFKKLKIQTPDLEWLGANFRLGEIPAFSLGEVSAGLPSMQLLGVPKNTSILREGEVGQDVFVLVQGQVSVNKKRGMFGAVEVVRLSPGDYFGEIAFLGRASRSATVTSETDCRVFRIPAGEFRALLAAKPQLGDHLKKVAEVRLNKLAEMDR